MHYDIHNPASCFYGAVGRPMPSRFIIKRVTVGSYGRLIGYLKLHVEPEKRYVEAAGKEFAEDEEDE